MEDNNETVNKKSNISVSISPTSRQGNKYLDHHLVRQHLDILMGLNRFLWIGTPDTIFIACAGLSHIRFRVKKHDASRKHDGS